jgi:hypothetical protein
MIVFWISDVPSPMSRNGASRMRPLDLVLLGVAVAAVDAERLLHHLGAVLGGEQLGHAGLDVVALAGVLQPGGVDHERVRASIFVAISASLNATAWCSAIGLPNVARCWA